MNIAPLWLHQEQALAFVDGKPAAMLAMAMGTGKTRVAVELLTRRRGSRALVLCPRSVVNVWPQQVAQYSSLTALGLQSGSVAKRRDAAIRYRGNIIAIN